MADTGGRSVRDDLVAGLAESQDEARRASVAAGWKVDPEIERMRVLAERDPQRFDETYGARGHLTVGFYKSGAEAAGVDLDDPGGAA